MLRSDNIYSLPKELPIPVDDGACKHLVGMNLPSILLKSTSGNWVDLSQQKGITVIYCYPRMGMPDKEPLNGWNLIPGARGCTPQSCAFRDRYSDYKKSNIIIFGLSVQDTEYQKEAVDRLHLPFDILSDEQLLFVNALNLPTFQVEGMIFIKRLTLAVEDGVIKKVFYPIFPADKNPEEVLKWLGENYPNRFENVS